MSEKRIFYPEPFPWLDYRRYTFSMGVEKKGVLFISGQSASQYDSGVGQVVCKGNVVEQMRLAYEKLKTVLEAAGASFAQVVNTVDYLTPQALAGYRGTADVRREYFKGSWPASTGVVVERLLRSDALIEVDAVAVLDARKESINPGSAPYDHLTFHPAVRAGDLLYLSGFTGHRHEAGTVPGHAKSPAAEQTAAIYETIGAVLQEAGATPGDLVKTLDYITPLCMDGYGSTQEVRQRFSRGASPASTGVVMNRLLRPEALIEVETTAVLGGQREEVLVPEWPPPHEGGSTSPPAVKKGRFLYLSGQVSLDHRTGSIVGGGDVIAQARQVYSNIRQVVEAAGGTVDDIVKTTEFITPQGLEGYRRVAELRREVFQRDFPAATGVVVNSLLRPGLLIQSDAIAILD